MTLKGKFSLNPKTNANHLKFHCLLWLANSLKIKLNAPSHLCMVEEKKCCLTFGYTTICVFRGHVMIYIYHNMSVFVLAGSFCLA